VFLEASGARGGPEKLIKMATDQLDRRLWPKALKQRLGPIAKSRPVRTPRLASGLRLCGTDGEPIRRAKPSDS